MITTKASIGLDIDGVICDIYPSAFKVLKEMYPDKVRAEYFNGKWEKEFGLTEQQVMDCFIEVGKRGLFRNASIYPGAKEVLYKINRRYDIYFISWRNYIPNAREDTLYWLDSNKIPYERLVMTNNKYKIATKEKFCFFLDDDVQQCNRLAKTNIPTFLFMRPWNKNEPVDALVKGIRSWKEVGQILNY
jgi:5'(3')-deoxyribonucleotidase